MDYPNFMNDYERDQYNTKMSHINNGTYNQLGIWAFDNGYFVTEIMEYLFILTVIPSYLLHAIFIYTLVKTHKTEKTVMIFRK